MSVPTVGPIVGVPIDGGASPRPLISVTGVTHAYPTSAGEVLVLDQLDLEVAAGAHVALTGPSGSGKSTLLALLGGLERPVVGRVVVAGHDLGRLSSDELAAFRRTTVGFVFQHFGLLDTLTALENVELACMLAGTSRRARRKRGMDLLEAVGLDARAAHVPGALSGGERQRVAIARSLANDPAVLLADEPTGNLDAESAVAVEALLESVQVQRGCTLVVVTHNPTLAARAGRHLRLVAGRLREEPAA